MKRNKKLLAVVVAGALTAATAVPALAMENEFHGLFRTYFDDSNFTVSRNGASISTANGGPTSLGQSQADDNGNFFESRLRLNYTAKLNDDVKIVSRFEANYGYWGNSSYSAGRTQGGALGSRGVNLETKQIYLDLNIPAAKLNAKIGMQPWTDDYQGIFVDADMPGVLLSHSYDKASVSAGFFRWDDADLQNGSVNAIYGKQTRDLYVVNGKFEVAKDVKIGAAYYFLNANLPVGNVGDADSSAKTFQMHMVGLNGEAAVGPVNLDGFVVTQQGRDHQTGRNIAAYAGNLGAKMAVGKGTARANFLYASGDDGQGKDGAFRVGSFESDFYNHEMVVLGRDKFAMINDNAIVFDANNNGQGVIFGALGFDQPISTNLTASANLGFAAVDKEGSSAATGKPINRKTGVRNGSDYLGTEVNAELGYKLNAFTMLNLRAGYVFLGDYWKDTAVGGETPENVYDAKVVVSVVF